eukprot:TRINITY_DN9796_c0_g2_i1.p1 TRINITY_DN9796_c0_g2~~TRINITY_DN9796_c0_g2_i1.p1  ORF type:complete len:166 (+),score=46.25 TRINITY_DN9796_c0_g2_i1:3-500(+)
MCIRDRYRSSILSTPSSPSNPVDGMGGDGGGGVDDPAFDVESFVGLLSGKGGVNGESVLYGKIGATPTSGTTAEELSASAGVAIKQWKMSRTGHLSSTTQRVSVMSRYALRAVRDLVQEAVNHVEHILSLIHISEPTRLLSISYAVFCLKKKKKKTKIKLFIYRI